MLKTLARFIKENKITYLIGGSLAIISGILMIIPNYMIQLFIDGLLNETLTHHGFIRLLGIFALVIVLIYVIDTIWLILLFGKSEFFTKQMRGRLFRRLAYLKLPFYETYRSGDLMTRMTSDIENLSATLAYGFLIIVSDGTWMLSILFMMLVIISWQVTLIAVVPLIAFGITVYFVGMAVDRHFEKSRDAVAQLSNEVLEVVDGVRVMRAYGKKQLEQARFQARTQEVADTANQLVLLAALFGPMARLSTGLSTALGLAFGGYFVNQGVITIGQLVTFQIYLTMLNGAVWGMADLVALYQQGNVSYRKIHELEVANDLMEDEGQGSIDQIDRIEFDHYHFTYPGDDQATLTDISFQMTQGQTLGIVGKTGSGKSTIVRQLLRQYPVSDPQAIRINDQPITEIKRSDLVQLIGYVPQDHVLFSRSIRDNILWGKNQASEEDLDLALQIADFKKDLTYMSQGLETLIGEKGVAISGGQKQRTSIARAIISQPDLLILDDSLSAVDGKTERAIIQNIESIRQGKSTIIITHRLSAVAHADWIIVVEEGRIVEEGTPQDLMAQQGWFYDQYLQQQMEEGLNGNL
ncbi:ABC transporter ATP-binding protein [Facklamia languida]